MTENGDLLTGNGEDSDNLPRFIMTESSRMLLKSIEDRLSGLVVRSDLSPDDDEFCSEFISILGIYDSLQRDVINASGINVVCAAGCSNCCCHWVEDVNSFEGMIISRYMAKHHPEKVENAINSFREDAEVLASLRMMVDDKIAGCISDTDDIPDAYELLLSCFYQLERPCALLDERGRCIVYPVRPLTCRDYLNLRDSGACLPERINDEVEATLIMNLSDRISGLLEILHRRFDPGDDDMSLRSMFLRFIDTKKE